MDNIKDHIRGFLDKHDKLKYIKRVVFGFFDAEYISVINSSFEINKMIFTDLQINNQTNKATKVIIDIPVEKGLGFFARYILTLELIYFVELFNYKFTVSWKSDRIYNDGYVDGTDDPFLYYFKPINQELEQDRSLINLVKINHNTIKLARTITKSTYYNYDEDFMLKMSNILKRYIALNDKTDSYIANKIKILLGNERVLGIHFRGTDYKNDFKGHPKYISPETYLEKIEEIFVKNKYDSVFIATDDAEILSLFTRQFKDKLRFYDDTLRSEGCVANFDQNEEREFNKYKLGLEVLTDMITLSHCQSLIATLSSVSIASIIHKYSKDERFEFLELISGGINDNKNIYVPK